MKRKTRSYLVEALHLSALIVLVAGISLWSRSGASFGPTQTSVVAMQHDEITGINFPVRHAAFVAGIEVPVLATAFAVTACGLSVALQRRARRVRA